ncbi:Alpha/Beta hydrolase protein [Zopfochytrium polystomum]|nr:Alpha/Beta hydrolase protein [Zopfochytrium polystomum]
MLQSDAAVEVVAREGKVRGLWIENGVTKPANGQPFTPAGIANKAVLLFAHGGGMNFGTAKSYALHHAHLVTAFNKQAEHRRRSLAVFSVEYPLAPEHTHPAQIDAVAEAYDWLKDVLGVEDLFVGGDSAGGLLVLQLVARLQNNGKPTPKKVILISPWVDPASTVPIPRSRFVFDYIEPPLSRLCLQNYFPRGIDSRAARVDGPDAPLAAVEPGLSDPEKYPPPMAKRTLIVYGDAETLAEPIERFIDAARAATTGKDGADPDRLRVVVGEGMPHEYPVLGLNLPGIAGRLAREAVETEAEFLTRV